MNIILSIDYEIFGDGSGSLQHCMHKPLDVMLSICAQHRACLSIFAETLEIQALLQDKKQASAARSICRQLQTACQNGHDVQLHLHPQWHQASPSPASASQSYMLNSKNWRIGDLAPQTTEQLIREGKQWLEALLQPGCKDYQCIAFRAGGWCIQPSEAVIQSLKNNGILIDSTVAPGAHNSSPADYFDFRQAPRHLPWWQVTQDVTQPANKGIYELPITTGRVGRLQHLGIVLDNMRQDSLAPRCNGSYRIPGVKESPLRAKLRKLGKLGHAMLDISTLPAATLIQLTQSWEKAHAGHDNVTAVAIGHTKNFSARAARELTTYLQWAQAQGHQFITYQQWLQKHRH